MRRPGLVTLLLALALVPLVRADEPDEDRERALALQRVMQRVIAQAEPSIACILVSRSDAYRRLGLISNGAPPGQLGGLDPDALERALERLPGETKASRLQLRHKLDLADPAHVPQSFGSGVVVDADGLILTNYHVVQEATKVYVRLPGGKGSYADVHAGDPRSDLAILRLRDRRLLPVRPLPLGDSDKLQRGSLLLSLANPFAAGFRDGQPSASMGILSNVRRKAPGQPRDEERAARPLSRYGLLLQTDVRLNLGCSGGALVNLDGALVGLTTAQAAIQGGDTPGGFALPINAGMCRILNVLRRGEEVEYGFLGVAFQAEQRAGGHVGVPLSYVTQGSPADLEGKLRHHDVLLAIDGVPIHDSDDLFLALGMQLAGSKVRLKVRRANRHVQTVEVTLARLHIPGKKIASSAGARPCFRGLRVDWASLLVQQPPRLSRVPPGVLISDIRPDSAAERARLKVGEVISQVNGRRVTTPAAFYRAVADAEGPIELTLYNFSTQEPPSKVVLR